MNISYELVICCRIVRGPCRLIYNYYRFNVTCYLVNKIIIIMIIIIMLMIELNNIHAGLAPEGQLGNLQGVLNIF